MVNIPKTISEKLDWVVDKTCSEIEDTPQKVLLPIAFIFNDQEATVAGMLWKTQEEEEAAIIMISKIAKEKKADLVITRSEAWYRPMKNNEVENYKPGTLSGYPDRKECVVFCANTKDHCWTGIAPIDRLNGKKTIGKIQWTDEASGLFTDILRTFH